MTRDFIAIARQYEADIVAGIVPACKQVRFAIARNKRDLERAGTPAFPFTFNEAAARAICSFAELLPYVSGRGFSEVIGRDDQDRPIYKKIQLQPWQIWILTTLFGWMNSKGLRRFRVALILVPRKNGKSTLGAIVSLFMLTEEKEPGAQCYSAATTRDQAKAVADVVWEMASRSPELREYYGVKLGSITTRSLTVPSTASRFMPLSADANSLDGLNISCAVIDELHAHKTSAVWQVIDTGTSARLQPLLMAITTAGVEIGGICHQKMGYLEKILDGTAIDEAFFGANYTIDKGDDERLPEVARKANPNYGVSVDPDDIARKVNEAQHSHSQLDNILTKHFNVWIRSTSTWMPMREWIALGRKVFALPTDLVAGVIPEALIGVPCWIGVDLAEVRDIAAIVILFRPTAAKFIWCGRYYLPERAIEKSPVSEMSGWARDGHIIRTDGDQADYQRIEDDLLTLCDRLNVREIDFDRALAAQMSQNLKRRLEPKLGRDGAERFVLTVPQTVETMNPAMQLMERLTLSGLVEHDGNPAGNWMFSNVVVERNGKDEIYPRKAGGKDSANKIDGPVAGLTTIGRASAADLIMKKKSIAVFAV